MATYATYLSAISGKTFPAGYFYSASGTSESSTGVNNVFTYSGSAAGFSSTTLSGTITSVNTSTGTFSLGGTTYYIHGSTADGNNLIFSNAANSTDIGSRIFVLANGDTAPSGTLAYSTANNYNAITPVCFATGTRILTDQGEVSVENLSIGDMVVTSDGRNVPIRWIGRRTFRCDRHPYREEVLPVQIEVGALADNVPHRRLRVSPGHALGVAPGFIINAGMLVNDVNIAQIDVAEVTYWHVELEEHALMYAEGALAESFIDVGNRHEFEGEGPATVLHPTFVTDALARYCATTIKDEAIIAEYREAYAARAMSASASKAA